MSLINKKKCDEKLVSIWMFVVWFGIAFAIIFSISAVYYIKMDVKEIQSQILNDRIINCIVDKGIDKITDKDSIFSECNINNEFSNFYFRIEIFDINSVNIKSISAGYPDIELQCALREKSKAENFARCSQNEVLVYSSVQNDNMFIKVFTGSNNAGAKI